MSSNSVQYFADKLYGLNWNRRNLSVLLILSGALAIFMFGMNINAQWWVIDDHEIVYFLGSDHILKANEIFEKLLHDTEIGHYLDLPRFRPVYYIIRLLECWAWGAKPSLWYAFRITIFASFVALFWYLISQKVGSVIGGFISLYIATQKYWSDIFGRLGPSESYAALGLALFGWGIHTIYKSDKVAGWWYLFVGAVICSGTKENFLFLLLPLLYIVWDFYKNGKLNFLKATLSLGACVWMIWIGFGVFISTQSRGGDVYANSAGIKDRFFILIGLFERVDVIVLLSICLGLLFLKRSMRVELPSLSKDFEKTAVSAIILTLIYISQIFIYNGEWPVSTRYDFPGALIGPLMLVVLISFFGKLTTKNNYARLRTGLIFLSTFGVFLLAFFQLDNIIKIRNATSQNIARTEAFSEKIEQLADLGIQNPDHVLIIQADNPIWDYESVISYFRFFRFLGVENQISFLWAGRKPEAYDNELSASLASDLRDLSFYGKLPPMLAGNKGDFTPYFDVDGSEMECILLVISGESQKECSFIVSSNWR